MEAETINIVSRELAASLRNEPWFLTVGIAGTELYVYTKKKVPRTHTPYETYQGFKVTYKMMGQPKAQVA